MGTTNPSFFEKKRRQRKSIRKKIIQYSNPTPIRLYGLFLGTMSFNYIGMKICLKEEQPSGF